MYVCVPCCVCVCASCVCVLCSLLGNLGGSPGVTTVLRAGGWGPRGLRCLVWAAVRGPPCPRGFCCLHGGEGGGCAPLPPHCPKHTPTPTPTPPHPSSFLERERCNIRWICSIAHESPLPQSVGQAREPQRETAMGGGGCVHWVKREGARAQQRWHHPHGLPRHRCHHRCQLALDQALPHAPLRWPSTPPCRPRTTPSSKRAPGP